MIDILERAEPYLRRCGSCDAGLPMSCVCPTGDYRAVMLELVREVERLREAELDRTFPRYRVKFGQHEGRIGRRMKSEPKAHPFDRQARVLTIEFPEGDSAQLWDHVVEKVDARSS